MAQKTPRPSVERRSGGNADEMGRCGDSGDGWIGIYARKENHEENGSGGESAGDHVGLAGPRRCLEWPTRRSRVTEFHKRKSANFLHFGNLAAKITHTQTGSKQNCFRGREKEATQH